MNVWTNFLWNFLLSQKIISILLLVLMTVQFSIPFKEKSPFFPSFLPEILITISSIEVSLHQKKRAKGSVNNCICGWAAHQDKDKYARNDDANLWVASSKKGLLDFHVECSDDEFYFFNNFQKYSDAEWENAGIMGLQWVQTYHFLRTFFDT